MTNGLFAANNISLSLRKAPGSHQASTGSNRGNGRAVTICVSMSSGKTTTTGPGRPFMAMAKARDTYSGRRCGSSTRSTRLAKPLVLGPKKLL